MQQVQYSTGLTNNFFVKGFFFPPPFVYIFHARGSLCAGADATSPHLRHSCQGTALSGHVRRAIKTHRIQYGALLHQKAHLTLDDKRWHSTKL